MKLKTRFFLWIGSFFVVIFAFSFLIEDYIAKTNLSKASHELIKALEAENEEKRKGIEEYLLGLLRKTEAQITALMYEIETNKGILKGFEPSLKHLEGGTWLNSASILATNKWVDFIECRNEGVITSQILIENNFLKRCLHFPINDELHLIAVADEKEPKKWQGPFLGVKLSLGNEDQIPDTKELSYFVFFTQEMILNFDGLAKSNENLNPSVDILEPFVKWVQIPEKKNYLEEFKKKILSSQALLKENPSLIPSEQAWSALVEKKIQSLTNDDPTYQSCLNFVEEKVDSHADHSEKNYLSSLAARIKSERDQYRKIGFTWGLSIIAASKIFGQSPIDPSFPLGIDKIEAKSYTGQALYTKSVFEKKPLLDIRKAIKNLSSLPINLNVFVLSGMKDVFLGSTLPIVSKGEQTARNGSLTIGVKGEFMLHSLSKAVHQEALYMYDKKIVAVSDKNGVIQLKSPLYQVSIDKLLEKRSGLVSIDGKETHFLKLTPSEKFGLHFFIFKSKKAEFSMIDQVTSGTKALINKISLGMRFAAIGGLICVLFILSRLTKGITAPISHLAQLTRLVEKGSLQEISIPEQEKKGGSDEVYTLYHAFFSMVKGLIEKEKVRGVLNKVVSKEIAAEILKTNINLGGEEKKITLLFADIRNFTHLTEKMDPSKVTELINTCMTKVSHIIDTYGGVIDKYVGDEVMALFGAPIEKEESALDAIKGALAICDALKTWNSERKTEGLPPVDMGIGIHCGPVIVGNMGAENRLNYTALGSSVNLASRLCSIAGSSEVLISKETFNEEGVLENIEVSQLEPVTLKGFSHPISIYKVTALKVKE